MSASQVDKYNKIKNLCAEELSLIEEKMLCAIDVHEPLNTYLRNFLTSPSKRIRSVLSILYQKAQGFNLSDSQLEVLSAVELVHNASLIHDDIIDESEFRRGEKTISSDFGNKLGVIAGDYLLSVAMEKISALNDTQILKEFSKTLQQMCIGEINQNFDRFKIGTIENYIEKSKNKTGYLFKLAISSTKNKHSTKDRGPYDDFGLNFGIAFQIRDDLLNISKSDKSKPSTDIEEGIYNAPIIYANSVENYKQGIEKTQVLLNNYIEKAKQNIDDFEDNIYTSTLNDLVELLKNE